MTLELQEILKCVSGELIKKGNQQVFSKMSIDSRNIKDNEMFLAIKGEKFNGNKYALDAIKQGVKLCILDELYIDQKELDCFDVSIIKVNNTLNALRDLAKLVRSKLHIDVIGVTGSVGKTTTKDLIFEFLSSKYKVYKVYKNFNNHIGMPLSLINIDDNCEKCVFELGMSNLLEIDYLSDILRPTIAIITNIGDNHSEFLKNRENILRAKLEITNYLTPNDSLIINYEDEMLRSIKDSSKFKVYRVGFSKECDIFAEDIKLSNTFSEFNVLYKGEIHLVNLPLLGKHNILNALVCFKVCEIFDIDISLIKERFKHIEISSMRQEIIEVGSMTVINDCYNASPTSMKCAIDVLALYNKKKVCILGKMGELGDRSKEFHKDVSKHASLIADTLIAIGEYNKEYAHYFSKDNCFCFETIEEFENEVKRILKGDEVLLIKASRSCGFERVVDIIKEKF